MASTELYIDHLTKKISVCYYPLTQYLLADLTVVTWSFLVMSLSSLKGVLNIFGGADLSPEEQDQLYKEVALMTLARATSADSNINPVEVDKVISVLKERTGEDFPASEVRVVAQSAIFERAPLDRYLKSSAKKLSWQDRLSIAEALAEVIKADDKVASRELNFFDQIAEALELTPSQLIGLKSGK